MSHHTSSLEETWGVVSRLASRLAEMDSFPIWTEGGSWRTIGIDQDQQGVLPHHGSWMAGDLPAILWLTSDLQQDPDDEAALREHARRWTARLANRTGVDSFASVSHMFFRGALLAQSLDRSGETESLLRDACKTIVDRFLTIGYMKSFGDWQSTDYPFTTVDDVINLGLPLWHGLRSNDPALVEAVEEAISVITTHLVRVDGSVGQVLRFDGRGAPHSVDTYQGHAPASCWSRGQAWGIYGYATIARLSSRAEHLDVAQRLADYWIDHVQDDPAPIWDFDAPPEGPRTRDSFAASLAYAGLLELADLSEVGRRRELRAYTERMLTALGERYVGPGADGPGILRDAALDVPHGHGVGEHVIVGDSYFVEAVWRVLKHRDGTTFRGFFPHE